MLSTGNINNTIFVGLVKSTEADEEHSYVVDLSFINFDTSTFYDVIIFQGKLNDH